MKVDSLKRGLGLASFLALGLAFQTSAATLVVDRNEGNTAADYVSLSQAVTNAAPNDVIYLMPSTEAYDLGSIEKPLTIIGSGFGKAEAFPLAPSTTTSKIDGGTITATNVFLSGLTFTDAVAVLAPSKGVTFFRNFFQDAQLRGYATEVPPAEQIASLHVINNWFRGSLSSTTGGGGIDLFQSNLDSNGIYTEVTDFVFSNNVFAAYGFEVPSGDGVISHNFINARRIYFHEGTAGRIGRVNFEGVVRDNFFEAPNASVRPGREAVSNNGAIAGSPVVNDLAPDPALHYASVADVLVLGDQSWGERLRLKPDSSLNTAASDGGPIGIFGGLHPWNSNMHPPIPIITRLDAPRVVGAGEGLSVTVEVQSNN